MCTNCGATNKDCLEIMKSGKPCCSRCAYTDTHHVPPTVTSVDPDGRLEVVWGEPAPVKNASVPVHALVVEDVISRMKFGIGKYGTPLQAGNGRDALKDAYEEALDLCCYLRQALEERDATA